MTWQVLSRRAIAAAVLGISLLALPGCADTRGRIYLRLGPPAPYVERRAPAPGPGFIWIEGYQRWDGRAYVWVPGRWERPPRPRARWEAGRWVRDRHGWYYVQGHWRD